PQLHGRPQQRKFPHDLSDRPRQLRPKGRKSSVRGYLGRHAQGVPNWAGPEGGLQRQHLSPLPPRRPAMMEAHEFERSDAGFGWIINHLPTILWQRKYYV